MSTAVATRDTTELQLAINREHAEVVKSASKMAIFGANCGRLLIEAKEQVPHGGWMTWLAENFDGSERVAQVYMQLARNGFGQTQRAADMESIRAALRSITSPRRESSLPKLDPESAEGRMLAGAKAYNESDVIDGEAIEVSPSGIDEKRWNTTLERMDLIRRYMGEAASPTLTADATAQALQEASIAARQAAVELERMAQAARRR